MTTHMDRQFPLAFLALSLVLQGCSSGSGGSGVGEESNRTPIARPLIVNSGSSNRVREGSEVFLTGRDSEDPDGPVLDWKWTAPAGIDLIARSKTTVSFTAPDVSAPTDYRFTLTVTDTDFVTDTKTLDVSVQPAGDLNRFLSPRSVQATPPDGFTVTAALRPGNSAGSVDAPFTIRLSARLAYTSRDNVREVVDLSFPELVAPIAGTWPAGQTVSCAAGETPETCMLASFVNSDYEFQVPRLDIAELNNRFLAAGQSGRQLDPHRSDLAVVEVTVSLDGGSLQDRAALLLSAGGNVVAQAPASVIGVPATITVPIDALLDGTTGEESRATAEAYLRTVDPQNRRRTLNEWLQLAGFAQDANGTLLPAAANGEGAFAHAKYTNNFDLGFGRDMYTKVEPNGNVYAFVVNYPTLEAAIKNTDDFVAVVMEYTPPDNPALDATCQNKGRFVKFFTFVPDERGNAQRVTSMNFDGRGERYTPGNCVTCHGGSTADLDQLVPNPVAGDLLYRDCGDTNATFMPWDLDSFLYSDSDPAIVAGVPRPDGTSFVAYTDPQRRFTRQAQEEQFRKLNAAALQTYETHVAQGGAPERVTAAIDLVNGWYAGTPKTASTRFAGSYTPPGWNTSPAIANVYHNAFARNCRACHTQLADSTKQFDTYEEFVVDPTSGTPRQLEDLIYRRGIMPLARLSMDRFWVPFTGQAVAAEILATQLAADPRVGLNPTLRPGSPVFRVARSPGVAKERDLVRLSSRESSFVRQPQWSALASTANGACIQPSLMTTNTAEVAFQATTPGRYCIQLASGGASTVQEFTVNANVAPVLVARSRLRIDETAAATSVDLEYTDADDGAAELIFTLVSALNGTVSLNGNPISPGATFTQEQITSGVVRFDPTYATNLALGATVDGGFNYRLTDGIASLPAGTGSLAYRVDIVGVNDGQPSVTVAPILISQLAFGGTASLGAAQIQASDPDTAPGGLEITVSVSGTSPAGTITPASRTYQQILNGLSFTYTHNGMFPIDLDDQLSVRIRDTVSGPFSNPVVVPVNARVSFANNITRLVDDPAEPNDDALLPPAPYLNDDCASCHRTSGPVGAPSFLSGASASSSVSHTELRNRVVSTLPGGEAACANPANAPTSLLLLRPTMSGHTGGVRPGFNLSSGQNRNNYNLLRVWICSFGAANN